MLFKVFFFYYLALSVLSGGMHIWDKHQAMRGRWRVQEKTLHSFELLGGWPGAFLITRSINHKVNKPKYMWTLYSFAALHAIGWFVLLWLATR
jgi:uncharacterized membrane protein YsdA (DUF1294 family)